jgi:hypothetical protein
LMSQMEDFCRQDERFKCVGHKESGTEVEKRGLLFDLPTSYNQLRSLVRTDSTSSLSKNLPHPQVVRLGDHSYMSVRQIVQEVLAYGYDYEDILLGGQPNGKVKNIGDSEFADEINNQASRVKVSVGGENGEIVFVILLTDWSDSADFNNSGKTARSVWTKTVTIRANPEKSNKLTHTYPIACGPHGSNHDKVEERFQQELEELKKGCMMYMAQYNKFVKVVVRQFATLMDQPERRNHNKIVAGNAKYGARFLYSCDWMYLKEKLPSCEECAFKLAHGK